MVLTSTDEAEVENGSQRADTTDHTEAKNHSSKHGVDEKLKHNDSNDKPLNSREEESGTAGVQDPSRGFASTRIDPTATSDIPAYVAEPESELSLGPPEPAVVQPYSNISNISNISESTGAPQDQKATLKLVPPSRSELDKSALVSKVLKKAREAAGAGDDQRNTGSLSSDQRSTGATRTGDQKSTGATRLPDQRSTGSVSRISDQRNTGASRFSDQRNAGTTNFDQKNTGATRLPDQSTTGATRFQDQNTTGSVPRISDQRSTGATPAYFDQTATGTTIKSLIGRPGESAGKSTTGSVEETDENAPLRNRTSLTATIEAEAKKSKVKPVHIVEKIVTKHPILVGTVAFCVFVLPIYGLIVNSQSPSERAEYKAAWGKDVKIIASKLHKPGEFNGHKVGFYVNRADAYIKSAEYQSAISDLKVARQLDPTKTDDCNLKLSDCYIAMKDYKKASDTSAEVLKGDPDNVAALVKHGRASYLFGNKLTALDDFFKAVKLDPSNPEVFIERGDFYIAEKKPGSAALDYKHALELAPSLAEAKKKLAACAVTTPVRRSASADAAEAEAKLSPAALKIIANSDFETLRHKGYEAMQKGDFNFAIAALSKAVALNPNGALVRQYLAHALIASGAYSDAVAQFNAWDKIAKLSLPEKLAFAKRLPAGDSSSAALYDQLTAQHAADGHALLEIANACQQQGMQNQCETAVQAGLKVATPAEKVQLTGLQVVSQKAAKTATGKLMVAN